MACEDFQKVAQPLVKGCWIAVCNNLICKQQSNTLSPFSEVSSFPFLKLAKSNYKTIKSEEKYLVTIAAWVLNSVRYSGH
jgi:hypothetical protein